MHSFALEITVTVVGAFGSCEGKTYEQPLHVLDVTEVSRGIIHAATVAGPFAVLVGVVFIGRGLVGGTVARTHAMLGIRGLSEFSPRWRELWVGLMVPLVGICALNVALAMEQEIREGPDRSIEGLVGEHDKPVSWILQRGTRHFMNDSRLPHDSVNSLRELSRERGIRTGAFQAMFAQIETEDGTVTGYVFGAPDGSSLQPAVEGRCSDHCLNDDEIIVDRDVGVDIGDVVNIRGRDFTVAAFASEPRSLLNRAIVYVTPNGFVAIETTNPTFYGVVAEANGAAVERLVNDAGLSDVADVLTTEQILDANRTFWAGGGTPLILIMIMLVAVLGGTSIFSARRAEQEHLRPVWGTLLAVGLTTTSVVEIDLTRALSKVFLATGISIAPSFAVVWLLNSTVLGFHARLGVSHVLGSTGVFILVSVVAVVVMALKIRRVQPVDLLAR